jgi:uncharacterized protein involved in outer membrane biogenesis
MTARRIAVIVVAIVVLVPILAIGAFVAVAQSRWGERWLESKVATAIHRQVRIEGIRVVFEWPPGLHFERIRISNPDWAKTKDLVDAEGLHARILPGPLFEKRIVIPYLSAHAGTAGLEMSGERATWKFGDQETGPSRIELQRVYLDEGRIAFRNENEDTALDIVARGSLGEEGELTLDATGKYRGEPSKAFARFPSLSADLRRPLDFAGEARVGKTNVAAQGVVGADFGSYNFQLKLAGSTFKDLYKLAGLALPDTPPYNLTGRLRHAGNDWVFDPFAGRVGDSDLRGAVTFRKGGKRPLFLARLESKLLDFKDLGPLVGAPPGTKPGNTMNAEQRAKAEAVKASTRVLPRDPIHTEKWDDMDADVYLKAKRILRPNQLPIDSLDMHIVLDDGVLKLDPLAFGVAEGRIAGTVVLDGREKPMSAQAKLDVQGLQLNRMFPTTETMTESLGTLFGNVELAGRGQSVGDLLGSSNGKVALAVDSGRVSELLTKLLEIDVAKAAMLLGEKKKQVDLRCAVANLDVKNGVAKPESFVVDTKETFVEVGGTIDLNHERLDLETHAKGKSPSLLTLKAPIVLQGPLKKPSVRPKAGPLLAQAGAAVALGAAAPPLAIAPFVAPGSGKDADCDKLLAQARAHGARKKTS